MLLRVHSKDVCPECGREGASHRVRRKWLVRWLHPKAQLMKCRLCLTRYLLRNPTGQ